MKTDVMTIEILENGDYRIETDEVSAANHVGAENLLREMGRLAGGPTAIRNKHAGRPGHGHSHSHGSQAHQH